MGLNIDDKKAVVAEVSAQVANAQSIIVAEYRGLEVVKITELRARAKENLSMAREKLADADAVVRARARQAAAVTDEYVHDNPWSSIGAAAALGILIGVLLGRR